MSQTNNSGNSNSSSKELRNSILQQRRKTGPTPKYGPDQAKKMVSMRLSPDALDSIKKAAEIVFHDSQADVVERMMRFFPPEALQKIFKMSKEHSITPAELITSALDAYQEYLKDNINPNNNGKLQQKSKVTV